MATALYTAPLASTPPVSTPRMAGGAGRRSTVVSFTRSGTSEDAVGSWRGGSSSFAESYGVPFSRSLTRSRTPETGSLHSLQQRAAQPRPVAPGVHRQASIPKSASFVRQEGFATRSDTPLSSPPASPQPRAVSSLLSRQLSTDGAGLPGFAFDDPLAAIQRLEQSLRLSPAAQPARPSRTDLVPAELLEALQVRGRRRRIWLWCRGLEGAAGWRWRRRAAQGACRLPWQLIVGAQCALLTVLAALTARPCSAPRPAEPVRCVHRAGGGARLQHCARRA